MSLVTADSVDTELIVRSEGVEGQFSADRVVVSAGETVALLLDGLHCVFWNNKNNTKLLTCNLKIVNFRQ